MGKKLTRLPNDKIIFGICSGIAKYLGWDKTVIDIYFSAFSNRFFPDK